ncbi:ATP-binding cassette domain-containing protein [Nocardia sp. ET3-3]|uniref:ATP-binding cassette domain-containing protein n=1 Tax=Nocardia terrae TaxID=2675851 RepID=A0A7K1UUT7_9NOCA|nr:ABC transporter ATP-binding protein [Nocardia terrae]MVU78085.1 ATP-binding cassette domain-containing protein [Nocardia terrae]
MRNSPPRFARLRLLWSFVAPHRRVLGIGVVLGLLSAAAGLATPMITKWVLDAIGSGASMSAPVATLLALTIFSASVLCLEWILLGTVGERVVLTARKSLVRRYFQATIPSLRSRPVGELVTRVTSDTVLLHEAASSSLIGLINGVVMVVGTLVLMAVLDAALFGATVAAVAVVGVLFLATMPGVAAERQRAQQRLGSVGGALEGALHAIRTVKAGRAEQRQADRILADAEASTGHAIRAVRREAVAFGITWAGVDAAIVAILALGAWRVGHGSLALSSLIAFLLYAFALIEPVTGLGQHVLTLQRGIAAAGRIREVERLELETASVAVEPDPVSAAAAPILEMRGVTADYGNGGPAVREIDLVIPRRGHVAIVGPSGSGKTTLLSLILRFLEPCQGTLHLDGRPYPDLGYGGVRRRLAYVEQDTPVVPGTIRENLLFSRPGASEEQLAEVIRATMLEDVVAAQEHGLDTPLSSSSISSGQRQRIAVARALLAAPDVLLLDEATAHADALTENAIHDCVRARARDGAVITVAHRLSTVVDADRIVVLEDGRIRAQGTHSELLEGDELYRELVSALRIEEGGVVSR